MQMNEISLTGRLPVDSYGPGGFRVEGAWHAGSLVLSPGGLHGFEAPVDMETLALLVAQTGGIDVVLIGQGAEIAPLAAPLRAALEQFVPHLVSMGQHGMVRNNDAIIQ